MSTAPQVSFELKIDRNCVQNSLAASSVNASKREEHLLKPLFKTQSNNLANDESYANALSSAVP